MITLPYKQSQRVIIEPGEQYVGRNSEVISTLLGSCVSACLYDSASKIFGMNHFLLAYRHKGYHSEVLNSEEGRYGIYAMEMLINAMMKKGANRYNLQAKCFGGSNVLNLPDFGNSENSIAEMNVVFIKAFLNKENIAITNSCLGGNQGRIIHFFGHDFSVFMKKIGDNKNPLIREKELSYLNSSLTESRKPRNTLEYL
jgi:chemotaxis protein CheD